MFSTCICTACSKGNTSNIPANELALKVAITSYNQTCLFNLQSDGKLEVLLGKTNYPENQKSYTIQANDYLNRENYKEIYDIGEKQLTEEQNIDITTLANKAYKNKKNLHNNFIYTDSLEVFVVIKDRTYNFYYPDEEKKSLRELVDKLIEISPIKVDLDELWKVPVRKSN